MQARSQAVKRITNWYIVTAVLLILLGLFSIIEPALAALSVALLVGWLLIFGGVAHLTGVFKGGGAKQVVFQVLIGIAYIIGGLYFLTHPLVGIGTLTLLLAVVLLVVGVLEIISYFRLIGEPRSAGVLFNGVIGLLLGGMIWFHWPSSSAWAIGTLLGVKLLVTGTTRLMFGSAARRLTSSASA